ncbi:MAG: EAL domain-containing protein [Clostridia bacterium]|nr:EAL domain-containing protein [Clostridia bacterium]
MNNKDTKDLKRTLLVVEDEEINRQILGAILERDYQILFAEDGVKALELLREHRDAVSLVLLDLMMPNMSGLDVLIRIRGIQDYQDIPVIVASADRAREIECLSLGASDFIQKPYPDAGVIQARVRRAIELFEGRRIIESTERDRLTGLYTKDFFYSYARQFDLHHPDVQMDAILVDINNFRIINERHGKAYADDVLRRVARQVQSLAQENGGLACRVEADTFQIYCPHREDYKAMLDRASAGLSGDADTGSRVRLRMGVYAQVDKSLEMERRFDRAKMSSDAVRNSFTRNIGVFDDTLHKAELYSMQLIEDFPKAIEEGQFLVYFQPKFSIHQDPPVLSGAEALVRWSHPKLGMVSPGVFIPLFEENGLIEELDHYVWREAAKQIHLWKEQFGFTVPVSVNVSRIDLNNPGISYLLLHLLEEYHLDPGDMHLEVTESAYAQDAEQLIEMVKRLRALGFLVEMDDFGTGYSSLNMLSTLPIDVLKLDMKFIQTAFKGDSDLDMITIIIEIARHIKAPVVAEGVETEQQVEALRKLGCDLVQGYYMSPPVPPENFTPFLEARAKAEKTLETQKAETPTTPKPQRAPLLRHLQEKCSISMRTSLIFFICLSLVIATALFVADSLVSRGYQHIDDTLEQFLQARLCATDLEMGSDEMTESVRAYVATGDPVYLRAYFEEAEVTRRRDNAVNTLRMLFGETNPAALSHLSAALSYSNELMHQEYLAMNLVLAATDADEGSIPGALRSDPLTPEMESLPPEEKQAMAMDLVFGDAYRDIKARIMDSTTLCTQELIAASEQARIQSTRREEVLLTLQTVLTVMMLLVVLLLVAFISVWILMPVLDLVTQIKNKNAARLCGAQELRYVAETYNMIFDENRRTHDRLTYGSMHDSLTGLYNRSAYDFMRHDLDMSHNALVLVDVDKFKSVNDTYGHDVGDLVLKRVAEVLTYHFRSTDLIFRLGGDEFVVIMTNVDSSIREQIKGKIDQANVMLQKPSGDLPPASLSVGVAFGDRPNPEGDIFKDADTALYRVKEAGRCGCLIF